MNSSETSTQQYRRLVASGWLPPEEKVKLTARVEALEKALKPFAEMYQDAIPWSEGSVDLFYIDTTTLYNSAKAMKTKP